MHPETRHCTIRMAAKLLELSREFSSLHRGSIPSAQAIVGLAEKF